MSVVESKYNNFISELQQTVKNVDVNLMLKVMYLQRILPDVPPLVELHIELKPEVNRDAKKSYINAKYGYPVSSIGEHGVLTKGQTSIKNIIQIAEDPDVVEISGTATPASY